MSDESSLPDGWVKKLSKSTGQHYYFNTRTNESQWTPPSSATSSKSSRCNSASDTVRCSHLLVKHRSSRRPASWREQNITRAEDEALKLIVDYRKRIISGQTSLEELASQYSDCTSAHRGGDLGSFARGAMQRAFEDVAFALNVGELSDPVKTDSGIHLIFRTA